MKIDIHLLSISESKPPMTGSNKKKERIDKLLFERGLAESRAKAQSLVMSGIVLADEQRIDKPSILVSIDAKIRIKRDPKDTEFASRGGLKLAEALRYFHICPSEYVCLDIGSSTGGFTDCLLKHGTKRVIAIDVGTNQLAWKLRNDPRVEVRENVNARYLKPTDFDMLFNLIVMDVSFISVTKIIPVLIPLLKPKARLIVLIKPQFEAGKGDVGKGGIVRDSEKHKRITAKINLFAESLGLGTVGVIPSPILGAQGNKEFLAVYEKGGSEIIKPDEPLIEGVDYTLENGLMVLTARFLLKRGYCCNSGCRNCPYPTSGNRSK